MSGQQDWRTPRWLFEALGDTFGPFSLDAASDGLNALCARYYTDAPAPLVNGLDYPWQDLTFCNPPFAKSGSWVEKALSEHRFGVRSVLVLPVGCSQVWFHKLLLSDAAVIYYPTRRISFDSPDGKPTSGADRDSIIVAIGYDDISPGAKVVRLGVD